MFPIIAYAETHYRFKYFFSRLKKDEPEIVADVPYRLEPDAELPVLLLIKDANLYSISLGTLCIRVFHQDSLIGEMSEKINVFINDEFWWKIFSVPLSMLGNHFGNISVDVEFSFSNVRGTFSYKNDNYRTSSHKRFTIFRSDEKYPHISGWLSGDTHTHSAATNDQVEFGVPVPAAGVLARAMGLDFFSVTDHSYDLDDQIGNYLVNDPALPKWGALQEEIDLLNSMNNGTTVLRGEEISCANSRGENIHLLLFGSRRYFPGSGDSAEKWFRTRADYTVREILAQKDPDSAAYAAHPFVPAPLLERIFFNRGSWQKKDIAESGLSGIQILNGKEDRAFDKGMKIWKSELLKGKRLFIAAGNDAHGNFNRYRQLGIPFLSIKESDSQLFGKMRTALFAAEPKENQILSALRNGLSVITTGPLIDVAVENDQGSLARTGDVLHGSRFILHVDGRSTGEFGRFKELRLHTGRIGSSEEIIRTLDFSGSGFSFSIRQILQLSPAQMPLYLRIEGNCEEGKNSNSSFCFTNPIWIFP